MSGEEQPGRNRAPDGPVGTGGDRAIRNLDDQLHGSLEQTERLIELIRSTAGFSIDKHEGVETAVTQIGASMGEVLSQFCGIKLEAETDQMALLERQFSTGEDAPPLICARVDMNEERPVLFFAASPDDFRKVLNTALGVTGPAGDVPAPSLSFSEQKLFLRFVDRLTNAIYAAFHHLSEGEVPRRPTDCPVEELSEFGKSGEAVLLVYKVVHGAEILTFQLVLPLWVLEPDFDVTGENAAGGKNAAKAEGKAAAAQAASLATGWDNKMREVVSGLNIPLVAELAAHEIPLAEVDNLQVGPLPGFEFAMDGLRILDADAKPVMIANLRIRDGAMELQVVKEAGRNAV